MPEGTWELFACPGCWSWQVDISHDQCPDAAWREAVIQEALEAHAANCPPLAFIDQGIRLDRAALELWLDG